MSLSKKLRVKPGKKVDLNDFDPSYVAGFKKEEADFVLDQNRNRLFHQQYLLYVENKRAVLVILQGMDASGKDGVIRHVMGALNPQGCVVTPFKAPVGKETKHDYLWRIHQAVPAFGDIGIFNRSHYEDVLVPRVKNGLDKEGWKARFKQINHFEKMLSDNGVTILKFFLHISKEEQKERLEARLKNPNKNWKFNENDLKERKLWDDYMRAYEDLLEECSTEWAPWYVIPSNKKWFRNIAVSEILAATLEKMAMRLPKREPGLEKIKIS